MLEDIPIRPAGPFTKSKDLLPIDLVFADHGLRPGAVRFDMNRANPSGIFLEDEDRILSAIHAIAGVQLHDDIAAGVAEEKIPGRDAADSFEIVRMREYENLSPTIVVAIAAPKRAFFDLSRSYDFTPPGWADPAFEGTERLEAAAARHPHLEPIRL